MKPDGVLQRAIEMASKISLDEWPFRVVLCQTLAELHTYVSRSLLTVDVGGVVAYNHLEWVQHRLDVERMRSTANVIASALDEFSRCVRDTEMPNDTSATQAVLRCQQQERDAIKEDFRIAIRRGSTLLNTVRQADVKPVAEQLSPNRLQNVTAIERMLIQLDETEKSFDRFWMQHEQRLTQCLRLRQFEEDFRKVSTTPFNHSGAKIIAAVLMIVVNC